MVIGCKNVTMNEPHFVGHFPDEPVMPGVLIVGSDVAMWWYIGAEWSA